jgi:hypothetical protein
MENRGIETADDRAFEVFRVGGDAVGKSSCLDAGSWPDSHSIWECLLLGGLLTKACNPVASAFPTSSMPQLARLMEAPPPLPPSTLAAVPETHHEKRQAGQEESVSRLHVPGRLLWLLDVNQGNS